MSDRSQALFRDRILSDVHADPVWYAGILARRAVATVLFTKLWPWTPLGGMAVAPARHPNEGMIDAYYRLTTTADWLGIGPWRIELPIPLLLLPTAAFLVMAVRRRGDARVRGHAAVWACLAAAALAQPVLVTTASALEPQMVLIVYFYGAAALADVLQRQRSSCSASRAG